MAENNITSANLQNEKLNSYYQSFLKQLPMETIKYNPITLETQTVDSITDQVSKYLRNYYDKSIQDRQLQTIQNNAEIDVDAASRGMVGSTWLTDAKNRQYQSEAADISRLNSDYNATLAETVSNQYQDYLKRKREVDEQNAANQIEIDEWNSKIRTALEQLAYSRAVEEKERVDAEEAQAEAEAAAAASSGGGGGSSKKQGEKGANYFVKDATTGRVTKQWITASEAGKKGENLIRQGSVVVGTKSNPSTPAKQTTVTKPSGVTVKYNGGGSLAGKKAGTE